MPQNRAFGAAVRLHRRDLGGGTTNWHWLGRAGLGPFIFFLVRFASPPWSPSSSHLLFRRVAAEEADEGGWSSPSMSPTRRERPCRDESQTGGHSCALLRPKGGCVGRAVMLAGGGEGRYFSQFRDNNNILLYKKAARNFFKFLRHTETPTLSYTSKCTNRVHVYHFAEYCDDILCWSSCSPCYSCYNIKLTSLIDCRVLPTGRFHIKASRNHLKLVLLIHTCLLIIFSNTYLVDNLRTADPLATPSPVVVSAPINALLGDEAGPVWRTDLCCLLLAKLLLRAVLQYLPHLACLAFRGAALCSLLRSCTNLSPPPPPPPPLLLPPCPCRVDCRRAGCRPP